MWHADEKGDVLGEESERSSESLESQGPAAVPTHRGTCCAVGWRRFCSARRGDPPLVAVGGAGSCAGLI